jgi:hypothetical protein
MSDNNDEIDVTGTANSVHQHKLYRDLAKLYTPEGANYLTSANLIRNGVNVPPEGVAYWHMVQEAAYANKLDLATEATIAGSKVNALTDAMLGRGNDNPPMPQANTQPEWHEAEQAELDDEEDDTEDDERSTLADIFGYDNLEDNEEAAADHVRKMQERYDD